MASVMPTTTGLIRRTSSKKNNNNNDSSSIHSNGSMSSTRSSRSSRSTASGTPLLSWDEKNRRRHHAEEDERRRLQQEQRRSTYTAPTATEPVTIEIPAAASTLRSSSSGSNSTSPIILLSSPSEHHGSKEALDFNNADGLQPQQQRWNLADNNLQHENSTDSDQTDVDDNASVDEKILEIVDDIEDEWDDLAYDQLVPLEVKLALEEKVFGWEHLTSDILGHALFTVGAFAFVYYLLTWLLPSPSSTSRWVLAIVGKWVAAIIASASSFRMVRRRRRVWLRAAYGSEQYLNIDRRQQLQETDKLTWMARLRRNRKLKKTAKKLKKADIKFQAHHEKRVQDKERHLAEAILGTSSYSNSPRSISPATNRSRPSSPGSNGDGAAGGGSYYSSLEESALSSADSSNQQVRRRISFHTDPVLLMQSVQDDQICFTNGPIQRVPYSHGGGFGAAPFMLANPHWIYVLRQLMPDVYVEISRRIHAAPYRLLHWAENNPVVAAYNTAHELEYNNQIPNMEWDVFLDPHLVKRVQIVLRERRHFLLSVLPELPTVKPMERLSPEILDNIDHLTTKQRTVVRYYEQELRNRVQDLVDEMLIAHGNVTQLALEQTGYFKNYNYSRVKRTRRTLGGGMFARQWMAVYAESLRIGLLEVQPPPPDIHATPRRCNRSQFVTSSPTSSPPSSTAWSATTPTPLEDTAATAATTPSSCPNTTIAASVSIIRQIVNKNEQNADDDVSDRHHHHHYPFGLYLDCKSRHVPPQVWACVVDLLRESGVRVEGVGAFVADEIRTLSRHTVQTVQELLFFHSAGDLQQACHNKKIQFGDAVFFNAGSLLLTHIHRLQQAGITDVCSTLFSSFDAEATKQTYRLQPYALPSRGDNLGWTGSTIQDYKRRYNLSIGLYVQEFAVDDAAANILVQLVNDHPEIYDLGLSWGGVNGITLRGIQPGRFTDTSGFWNQRHLGALWDSSRHPPV